MIKRFIRLCDSRPSRAATKPISAGLPATMATVYQDGNGLEAEQFRNREAMLAVGAPTEGAIPGDVDVDLVHSGGDRRPAASRHVALTSVPIRPNRFIEAIDRPAPPVKARTVGVPPRIAKPLELVAVGLKKSRFAPRPPRFEPLSDPGRDGPPVKRLPSSIPWATLDATPLWVLWRPLEDAALESVGIDFDDPKRVGVGVAVGEESATKAVDTSKGVDRNPSGKGLGNPLSNPYGSGSMNARSTVRGH